MKLLTDLTDSAFLSIVKESEEEFETIAAKLFHEFAIQNQNGLYRFVEIEFYWNSSSHVDNSTYSRKYANPKSGDWFFHYSGVDIALNNEQSGGYGGILIRSIYDCEKKVLYKGPMVCVMKLFSGTNAFSESIKTEITPHAFHKSMISKRKRVGLGNNAKENGADKLNYSFLIDPRK